MHCLSLPWRALRYKYSHYAPWFVSADDAIAALRRGESVDFATRRSSRSERRARRDVEHDGARGVEAAPGPEGTELRSMG